MGEGVGVGLLRHVEVGLGARRDGDELVGDGIGGELLLMRLVLLEVVGNGGWLVTKHVWRGGVVRGFVGGGLGGVTRLGLGEETCESGFELGSSC